MIIELKKFGQTLTSRDEGREAFAAFTPTLNTVRENELVKIHFFGINTLSPSWADEFITPLLKRFNGRLTLVDVSNPSVKATIELLEKINGISFNVK